MSIRRVKTYSSSSFPTSVNASNFSPWIGTGVKGTCLFVFFRNTGVFTGSNKKISSLSIGFFPDSENATLLGEIECIGEAGRNVHQIWVFPDLTDYSDSTNLVISYTGTTEATSSLNAFVLHGASYSGYSAQSSLVTDRINPTSTYAKKGGYTMGFGFIGNSTGTLYNLNGSQNVFAPVESEYTRVQWEKYSVQSLSDACGYYWLFGDRPRLDHQLSFNPVTIPVPLWAMGRI